ncbi:tetratricopeptide repeat protein [Endomicrobium proavitum]|uniref:TPR repeat-containing protein n=1 Tax=Endomicrobium proavitum TaxID=1408281 RepID=A0A0G3WI90_9BACT|nr:tetratricopeptide repeat protein [Endomicrobium proavitum]AKL97582.1 TPR repeat-containing protein [Endomicrobium proavitum]
MGSKNIENETAYLELGKFYFMNDKQDEAVLEFKKVLELNPENAEAYYNLGLINESANKITEAKNFYAKALQFRADYKSARERLNKLIGLEDE